MTYDPTQDPRYLPDSMLPAEDQLVEQVAQLPAVQDVLDVFTMPGWESLAAILRARLEESKILGLASKEMVDLAEYRGKIKAYNTILGLPHSLQVERERLIGLAERLEEVDREG